MTEGFDNRRRQLLELNTRAWNGDDDVFPTSNLDSSMKKNTSVIKKLRVFNHDTENSILKDISTTLLTKYLSELISATFEGLMKCKKDEDVQSAVEIVSALHQRFTIQFTPFLLSEILFGVASPLKIKGDKDEKEEAARINKQKVCLRLLTEFLFVGVFHSNVDEICDKDSLPDFIIRRQSKSTREYLLLSALRDVLGYEYKLGITISLATSYLKKYAHYFLNDDPSFLSDDTKESLLTFFDSYTSLIFDRTKELYYAMGRSAKNLGKAAMRTGKIIERIEENLESIEKQLEKFKTFSKFLSETFDKEMPAFERLELDPTDSIITGVHGGKSKEWDTSVWENEEQKKFYTDYPDISSTISPDVLNFKATPADNLVTDGVAMGERMNMFLELLDNSANAKDVDNAVYEFWYMKLNNKASRNKLLKVFMETQDTSKLKYYARFIAINQQYLPQIKDEMIKYLDGGFRSQIHTNRLNFKNITFFCELIKFKLVPIYVLFHKVRSLILNITVQNNIEILGIFFENCGKLLLNDSEYKGPMAEMLDLLQEKRKKGGWSITERYSIDTMMLILKPPPVRQFNLKEVKLSPQEEFLNVLLKSELKDHWQTVLATLKKIDFNSDDRLFERFKELLTHPEEMDFNCMPHLAKIVRFYTLSSKKLRVYVIDTVIENIMRELEKNDYRSNRIRLSHVSFLADLANEELVNFNVIINIMYKILTFGYPNNNPMLGQKNNLDPPDNYFRLSLICQILTRLNLSKLRKNQAEKLELFLSYFDYFCNLKQQPIPLDTNFKLVQMYKVVKPDYTRSKNLKQAVENLQGMMALMNVNNEEEEEEEENDEEQDVFLEIDEFDAKFSDEESEPDDTADDQIDDEDEEEEEEEDDEPEEVQKAKAKARNAEYEAKLKQDQEKVWEEDLEKEMKQMILQSIEQRKYERVSRFNAQLPPKQHYPTDENANTSIKNSVSFTLLSKNNVNRNKKPVVSTRRIELPSDVKFATKLSAEGERQKSERDRLKSIVLNMRDD